MAQPAFLARRARIHEAAPADPPILCQNLGQFTQGQPWRLSLPHDRAEDLVIWITRGQGKVVIDGIRRGLGAHNALYLPKGTLIALDLGAQTLAQVVSAPPGLIAAAGPEPRHLRIRDGLAQADLTALIEAMARELQDDRPHLRDALGAHLALVSVWLKRHEAAADHPSEDAGTRLARRFSRLLVARFRSPMSMADYAAALEVTPTHLTRTCRATAGLTAADLLSRRKLHAARMALAAPAPPIRDIARDLGFGSAAYFTRFIQTRTGFTPSALRRSAAQLGHRA